MNKTIGFIGCGNMAQAMIGGIVKSNLVPSKKVIGSNPSDRSLNKVKEEYNILVTKDNVEVAKFSDILILAVKPYKYFDVIHEIKPYLKKDVVIITIAAGITLESMGSALGDCAKVIRTMPNTPALVGEGMSALCANKNITKEELQDVVSIFESFGKVEILEENLIEIVPAVSGSSPAYVYMFIEALGDGAVLQGMPRDKAYRMAAQAVLGAAKMVLETGEHPGKLKDNVCSPGGTTIEAVYTLEKNNFRGSVISAMESCTEKAIKMGKK
ncbi:pyrroline-5-carboxylate reductase [Clostridium tagluense]|uniref:pyrroline-5-carboxylate reductase n=1 Tax=Clostridium TaxID=1485 RepID=UPI0013E90CA6|nr:MULTISPECIES: pyrroline-5-carboxylate reductase [Clostridium]MBU3129043.1 pyrroline-5-carboxylate reductase [Clostridium tagluense]MBW9156129.1 pyrroline-5-carboxylate reductase [Clostridium tagluense]MBZ9625897.1 pyrroline-5-carboxylate reductase [Clostridium sp. FP2]MCB2311270.1 pyrroline-5-carboxylate reductase [Clostridium tagluense]MCB2316088.1 pyrroline-5-carboxylate reductase [Clostridium tagluense]